MLPKMTDGRLFSAPMTVVLVLARFFTMPAVTLS
jgi:hypothetical protein